MGVRSAYWKEEHSCETKKNYLNFSVLSGHDLKYQMCRVLHRRFQLVGVRRTVDTFFRFGT